MLPCVAGELSRFIVTEGARVKRASDFADINEARVRSHPLSLASPASSPALQGGMKIREIYLV